MLTWLRAVGPDTEGNLGTQAVHLLSETCLLSRKIMALLLKPLVPEAPALLDPQLPGL